MVAGYPIIRSIRTDCVHEFTFNLLDRNKQTVGEFVLSIVR